MPSSCPHSSQCSVNLKGIGKPGWRISLIIKIILDTEDQHDQVSTSTLLPAKLTSWAGGDSAIPEASAVIFATYSLGQTNLHNLFCHNKKSLKIQYWCGALWKAWEWSGMLCGGGVKKQAAEERSTQGQELSGQSCQSLHWLFSQHFDKQLKSSKLSLNSLQDCFQMALIFIFALSIIDVATKDHGNLLFNTITLTTRSGYSLTTEEPNPSHSSRTSSTCVQAISIARWRLPTRPGDRSWQLHNFTARLPRLAM